ncbi:hypothetical protein AB0A95_08665 [Micromonospora sp. NPDC049230]|uniref:hypothetical protein n=1 Tax=Micromonospora sp. NPDC049230 TaxID=3155502 RepID=UPI0033E6B85B
MTENQDKTVGRRQLLRRAGTVAAGVAGTTVVGAAAAGSAQADPGQPVVQAANNVVTGGGTTALVNPAKGPTLRLENTNSVVDGKIKFTGPALQLAPSGDLLNTESPIGSMGVDKDGNFQVVSVKDSANNSITDYVHTTGNSNRIVPIIPQRVIDTRDASLRARIQNASSTTLDSEGRLRGGQTIHVLLEDYVYYGDALFGIVTATTAVNAGFLQIFPYDTPRPASFSSLNYAANQVNSNAFVSGIGESADYISIYALQTTHVVLDVTAFVIGYGTVNPDILPFPTDGAARGAKSLADRRAERAAKAKQGKPSWE